MKLQYFPVVTQNYLQIKHKVSGTVQHLRVPFYELSKEA